MITLGSPIIGKGSGVGVIPNEAKRKPDLVEYQQELIRLCRWVGFNEDILLAQSAHETANWTSHWWASELNPAGIGIFDDGSTQRIVYSNGTDAARAQVVHMCAYVKRGVHENLLPYTSLDPRLQAVYDAGFAGSVTVLRDLGGGKWATDPNYAAKIVTKAASLFSAEETPVPEQPEVVFGRVPFPPIVNLICPKPYAGAGYTPVPPRDNVGVCEHITDGRGSIEFYHDFFSTGGERATDALVDFVIGRDGRIGMLNDWRGTRAPWANGTTDGLEGDGPAFINRFGVGAVNSRLVSIEHEGLASEDWTGAQWNASVALVAALFDAFGVRYDSFPVHQQYGVVTHLLHSEFTGKGGNALDECPGRYLKRNISAYQTAIKAVMMGYQVVATQSPPPPPPDVTPAPEPFPGFRHGLEHRTDKHVDKTTYFYLDRLWTVLPGETAQRYDTPDRTTEPVEKRKGDEKGSAKVRSAFLVRLLDTRDNKTMLDWLVDPDGGWWPYNVFDQQIPLPIKRRKR